MFLRVFAALLAALITASGAQAAGNEWNDSFNKAKKTLERQVYYDHWVTFYCGAAFDEKKNVILPEGFMAPKHEKRAGKVEWEHVVPAENFGRAFPEWHEGDAQCVDKRGKAFKGRKCAEKVNREYRLMQSDMYNLYPAIGAVNALRQNYNFQMLPGEDPDWTLRDEARRPQGRAPPPGAGTDRPDLQVYGRRLRPALPHEPPAAAAHGRMGQDVSGGCVGVHAGQAHREAARQRKPVCERSLPGGRAVAVKGRDFSRPLRQALA